MASRVRSNGAAYMAHARRPLPDCYRRGSPGCRASRRRCWIPRRLRSNRPRRKPHDEFRACGLRRQRADAFYAAPKKPRRLSWEHQARGCGHGKGWGRAVQLLSPEPRRPGATRRDRRRTSASPAKQHARRLAASRQPRRASRSSAGCPRTDGFADQRFTRQPQHLELVVGRLAVVARRAVAARLVAQPVAQRANSPRSHRSAEPRATWLGRQRTSSSFVRRRLRLTHPHTQCRMRLPGQETHASPSILGRRKDRYPSHAPHALDRPTRTRLIPAPSQSPPE